MRDHLKKNPHLAKQILENRKKYLESRNAKRDKRLDNRKLKGNAILEDDDNIQYSDEDSQNEDLQDENDNVTRSVKDIDDAPVQIELCEQSGYGTEHEDDLLAHISETWEEELRSHEDKAEGSLMHGINDSMHMSKIMAQFDNGSDATTSNEIGLLFEYKPLKFQKYLADAGGIRHQCIGEGLLKIPLGNDRFRMAHCWHTPSMPVTILSLGEMVKRNSNIYTGFSTMTNFDEIKSSVTFHGKISSRTTTIPLDIVGKLLYTKPLVPSSETREDKMMAINSTTERTLWHQRLCHLNLRKVSMMHKFVDRIPKMSSQNVPLEGCPSCFVCKMKKAARGDGDIRADATKFGDGISLDWGFVVQTSKDNDRMKLLTSDDGDQSYLLLADHAMHRLFGIATGSKRPPLKWLNQWLSRFSPEGNNKYACMDQGGELGKSREVRIMLERFGYHIRVTAPEGSHQNSPGERPHQIIGDSLRTMLHGANLPYKLWPWAFNHILRVHSYIPHGSQETTPHGAMGNSRSNLSKLKTFGCRVYVKSPGRHQHKLDWDNVFTGIFLGYTSTLSQIYYLDLRTKRIKTAIHCKFDEGMNDLPDSELTPNARHLR